MKSGIKTLIAGVLLLVSTFFVPLFFVLPLIFGKSDAVQFKIPGKIEFTATDAGRYYLWNDYQTVYQGRSYDNSENLPGGIEITVRDTNGSPLQFISDGSTSATSSGPGRSSSAKTIGYVEVEHPGKLEIEVSGGNEERIFSFAKSASPRILGLIVGGMGLTMLIGASGLGLIIWGVIKLVRASKDGPRAASGGSPQP